ncbi:MULTISPECIES: hypothetical protein [Xanthomonas]|uniref:hypothetical protein n=1 Tax=Xanthomonas TaxID=338 RepID=UPI001AD97A66|nr:MULTISPECIES: hypothetical protein [unclassified Xanthomonas]MBO9872252.1 hypothetical protein [Xanthomonas sp. D-93]WNH45906.1 hypothetical protein PG878_05475 [Xanthomonas sp. A6251]
MRPHPVIAPARVAPLGQLASLATAPHRTASALLDRLQAGEFAEVESDLRRSPALNQFGIAGTGAPGPAEYATPGHVDPALIADVGAWMRTLPASHGAAP